jgi:hypothetical protein
MTQEGKFKPFGLHRADNLYGTLLVLLSGKTDISFSFQNFEIGGHRVVRLEIEMVAYLVKTGSIAPFPYVPGNITQKCLLFFCQFHAALLIWNDYFMAYSLTFSIK